MLVDLARGQARLEGLRLAVLAAADTADIAQDSAATSTAAWVAQHTRQTRPAAHADLALATALDRNHPVLQAALAAGRVDLPQARVITRALADLPDSVTADQRTLAEQHLITLAADHDAGALKVLGRRVVEVIDPDAADQEEGRKLEAEEAAAARVTYLHLFDNGDGTHTGRFKIPTLHAAMLTRMLQAILSPARHATGTTASAPASATRRRGQPGASRPTDRPDLASPAPRRCRGPRRSATRSVSSSNASPPTASPPPAAPRRPWWC